MENHQEFFLELQNYYGLSYTNQTEKRMLFEEVKSCPLPRLPYLFREICQLHSKSFKCLPDISHFIKAMDNLDKTTFIPEYHKEVPQIEDKGYVSTEEGLKFIAELKQKLAEKGGKEWT